MKFHLAWSQGVTAAFFLIVERNGTGIAFPEGTSRATK